MKIFPVVGEDKFDVASDDSLAEGVRVAGIGTECGVEGGCVSDGSCQSARSVGAGSETKGEIFSTIGIGIGVSSGANFTQGTVGTEIQQKHGIRE